MKYLKYHTSEDKRTKLTSMKGNEEFSKYDRGTVDVIVEKLQETSFKRTAT